MCFAVVSRGCRSVGPSVGCHHRPSHCGHNDAMSRRKEWITAALVVVVSLAVGGALLVPFVYINFIKEDAPARFTLDDTRTTTAAGANSTTAPTAQPAGSAPTTTS